MVEGCDKPVLQKGYCRPHYMRWWRHGDPLGGNADRGTANSRSKEYKHQHYLDNIDAYKERANAQDPAMRRGYQQKYRGNNPARYAYLARVRKGALRQATPKWLTEDQWSEMNEKYFEARRLTEETGIEHHVDHIEPLLDHRDTVMGLHVPWNLQVITAEDNYAKRKGRP